MDFTKEDLMHFNNLSRMLDKASYKEMNGNDIVAFYRTFVWAAELHEKIKKSIEMKEAMASMKIHPEGVPMPKEIIKEPAKVSEPVIQNNKTKVKKSTKVS